MPLKGQIPMKTAIVSILSPSFNQSPWLGDNLRSVRNQTYPDIEHVVMDGGSTDDSLKVLNAAGSSVRWRSEPDRGQSHALNKAFAESTGDIIGWLNSDDAYVDRRAVATAVEAFEADPELGVVYGHGLLVNQHNRALQFLWAPPFRMDLFRVGTFFVQPSVFIRRAIIEEPFVDESLHFIMDHDLWWRLIAKTKFARIDIVAGLDRHQPARKTLLDGYPVERESYERRRGIDPHSRKRHLVAKASKICVRLAGTPKAITAPNSIELALPLTFGSLSSRFLAQTATPRRRMSLT